MNRDSNRVTYGEVMKIPKDPLAKSIHTELERVHIILDSLVEILQHPVVEDAMIDIGTVKHKIPIAFNSGDLDKSSCALLGRREGVFEAILDARSCCFNALCKIGVMVSDYDNAKEEK